MSEGLKTSLGIWAFGPMITRFVPGGYKPEFSGETTVERVRRAVEGLGDLIDGYEFHYPQELNEDNLDDVREALAGHDVYCMATGLHLDPRFGKGGLVSPDEATRAEAVRRTLTAIDFAGELGLVAARHEPRHHRAERPDPEAGLHVFLLRRWGDSIAVGVS